MRMAWVTGRGGAGRVGGGRRGGRARPRREETAMVQGRGRCALHVESLEGRMLATGAAAAAHLPPVLHLAGTVRILFADRIPLPDGAGTIDSLPRWEGRVRPLGQV